MTEGEETEFGWSGSKPKRAAASTDAGECSRRFLWFLPLELRARGTAHPAARLSSAVFHLQPISDGGIAELILPTTQDAAGKAQPGASEAGVAEFIDFMVFSDPSLQPEFHHGLQWLDHAAAPAPTFFQSAPAQQHALLERLAYKAHQRQAEKAGQQFFRLFRRYTVMGFYTTRIGLESLDYPGLKFYAASPGCTHAGNPEHLGL